MARVASVGAWRRRAALALAAADIDAAPALEADVLLGHALGVPRTWLYAHADETLELGPRDAADALLQRRLAGEPVAYLTGEREFRSRVFAVGPDVLVPRDDTEVLVEAGLRHCRALHARSGRPLQIVDAGTGSGIVIISIALECAVPARFTAIDRSLPALAVAERNAACLRARIDVVAGDWLAPLLGGSIDLVVANPPYVRAGDARLRHLAREPRMALVAGEDGMADLEQLVEQATRVLVPGGALAMEHGFDQAEPVVAYLRRHGYRSIETDRDIAGHGRVTSARRPG